MGNKRNIECFAVIIIWQNNFDLFLFTLLFFHLKGFAKNNIFIFIMYK